MEGIAVVLMQTRISSSGIDPGEFRSHSLGLSYCLGMGIVVDEG